MIELYIATPRAGKGGLKPHGLLKAVDGRIIEGTPASCIGKKLSNYRNVTFTPAIRCVICKEIKEEYGFGKIRGKYTTQCKACLRARRKEQRRERRQ